SSDLINWLPQTQLGDAIPTPFYNRSSSNPIIRAASENQPDSASSSNMTDSELMEAAQKIDFRLIHFAVELATTYYDSNIHGPNGTDSLRAKYADVITEETLQRIEVYERLNPNSHLWNPAVIARAYLCSEQSKLILALLKEGIAFDALQKWRMCVAYAANMYELDMPLDGFERNPRPMTVAGT